MSGDESLLVTRAIGPTGKTILGALVLTMILSIGGAGWHVLSVRQDALRAAEMAQRARLAGAIAEAMADPLLEGRPEAGRQALGVAVSDPRLVAVEVRDSVSDSAFLDLNLPGRAEGGTTVLDRPVVQGGRTLGRVHVVFTDTVLETALAEARSLVLTVFGGLALVNLALLVPLVLWRVALPLRRLADQAEQIRANRLETGAAWSGRDEIGRAGQGLETARAAMVRLLRDLKARTEEVKTLSTTDRLTGLANRRRVDAVLESEIHRALRFRRRLSILMIEVDQLRDLNLRYGRHVGDAVLTEAALRLSRTVRPGDTVGRWGDGSFLVVCPATDAETARDLAEAWTGAISGGVFPGAGRRRVSAGVATHDGRESIDALLGRAEAMLHPAAPVR